MSSGAKIVLNVVGALLSVGGGILLLLGVAEMIAGLAWTNGSLKDILILILFGLYALPAGAAMLFGGTLAISSANAGAYVVPTVKSQRTISILLLLPAMAAVLLLMVGYPFYRFWAYSTTISVLLVLLAFVFAALGIYILKQARTRGFENMSAGPR